MNRARQQDQTVPAAIDSIEIGLVGLALLDPAALSNGLAELDCRDLSSGALRAIWAEVLAALERGDVPTADVIGARLQDAGRLDKIDGALQTLGGAVPHTGQAFLWALPEAACMPSEVPSHLRTLRERAARRRADSALIGARTRIASGEEDPCVVLAELADLDLGSGVDTPPALTFPAYLSQELDSGEPVLPWLSTGEVGLMVGQPGAGKTWLAIACGFAVANGLPVFGWSPERPRRGCLFAGEGTQAGFADRAAILCDALDLDLSTQGDFLIYPRGAINPGTGRRLRWPDLGTADGQALFRAIVEAWAPELIFIDNLRKAAPSVDENDNTETGRLADFLESVAAQGRAVCLLHHEGKDSTRGPRGASALLAAVGSSISVSRRRQTGDPPDVISSVIESSKQRDGAECRPTESTIEIGARRWTWQETDPADSGGRGGRPPKASQTEIVEAYKAGCSQVELAARFGVTARTVSRYINQARSEGVL